MVTVLKHGDRRRIKNPVDGVFTEVVNVQFAESGRSGAVSSMNETSALLSRAVGAQNVGLDQTRVHTHPIKVTDIDKFPLGKKIEGLYINRKMFSQGQIRQQDNVEARMIDGKPTYFLTYIGNTPEQDLDLRMTNETLAIVDPNQFRKVRTGVAQVDILESVAAETQLQQAQTVEAGAPQGAGTENLGQ